MRNPIYRSMTIKKSAAKKLVITFLLVSLALIWGCASKPINPMNLPVTASDKVEAEFPPTEDELIIRAQLMLPLIVYKDQTTTEQRLTQILSFLNQGFEQNANIAVIPQQEVRDLLSEEENKRFQSTNVADAIQLGNSLKAKFVSQIEITIVESKIVKGVDQFSTNINITIFTTDSGQVVFQKNFNLNTQKYEKSEEEFKILVQRFFPVRGYILETRGGHQVAKISLGRSLGIKLNREFHIRDRQVKTQMAGGATRRIVSFSPTALTTAKVIKVMENESWILIDKKDRIKIKSGQVVFALPEKKSSLF